MTAEGRPQHVMYLVTSSGVGGAERQVRDLALEFRRRGWTVTVVSMLPLEPTIADLAPLVKTSYFMWTRGGRTRSSTGPERPVWKYVRAGCKWRYLRFRCSRTEKYAPLRFSKSPFSPRPDAFPNDL